MAASSLQRPAEQGENLVPESLGLIVGPERERCWGWDPASLAVYGNGLFELLYLNVLKMNVPADLNLWDVRVIGHCPVRVHAATFRGLITLLRHKCCDLEFLLSPESARARPAKRHPRPSIIIIVTMRMTRHVTMRAHGALCLTLSPALIPPTC